MASKITTVRVKQVDEQLPNKDNLYWNEKGKHQEKCKILLEKLDKLVSSSIGPFKWTIPVNSHWAVFNGMVGCYYGYYNDGDNASGAIDNNRVHGYSNAQDFAQCCRYLDASTCVLYVLDKRTGDDVDVKLLERAMDQAILVAWNEEAE
jgi:hypothetical protein